MFGVKKIIPKRNAVIITYDENGQPSVTIECKDYDFEYPLVIAARHYLACLVTLQLPKEIK